MKRYQEFLGENLNPRRLGKNREGMTVYGIGNRYFVVSYSSMADETAVFLAKNAQGDVDSFDEIVSVRGYESDEKMLQMTLSAISRGEVQDPGDRMKTEAERSLSSWDNRIAQMERHIQAAQAGLVDMKATLEQAQSHLDKGDYRIVLKLTSFRPGTKPWER
jgi:hypothetical protein